MADDTAAPLPRRPRKPRAGSSAKPETASGPVASGSDARKADAKPFTPKQAVLVIHGMGEQRPLETLRSFVDTVYVRDPAFGSSSNAISFVPDDATGSAELRRITTHPPEGKRTDFYEFYWADIMDGTPVEQVTSWITGLLLRSPARVPARVQVWLAWLILWALTLIFIGLTLVVACPQVFRGPLGFDLFSGFFLSIRWWLGVGLVAVGVLMLMSDLSSREPGKKVNFMFVAFLVAGALLMVLPDVLFEEPRTLGPVLLGLVGWVLTVFVAPYFGDVVRYARATPKTVGKRAAVRERGMALLTELHNRRGPAGEAYYDRIVVVGHSLGTIIAYDLLQYFWQQKGPTHLQDWDPRRLSRKCWLSMRSSRRPGAPMHPHRPARGST